MYPNPIRWQNTFTCYNFLGFILCLHVFTFYFLLVYFAQIVWFLFKYFFIFVFSDVFDAFRWIFSTFKEYHLSSKKKKNLKSSSTEILYSFKRYFSHEIGIIPNIVWLWPFYPKMKRILPNFPFLVEPRAHN